MNQDILIGIIGGDLRISNKKRFGGIKIEGEKKVLGIIVGLIFIIIVVLAILVSVNEQARPGQNNVIFAGDDEKADLSLPDNAGETQVEQAQADNDQSEQRQDTRESTLRENRESEKTVINVPSRSDVVVLSPFQITEAYSRARAIVLQSQCYQYITDLREITYYTDLTGTKFIANMLPNEDYTMMTVVIGVKLSDNDMPVYYDEIPVEVDLMSNKIVSCKGRQISLQDLYGG